MRFTLCLLAISIGSSARADIIFAGASSGSSTIYDLNPHSDSDYKIPTFTATVTPYLVTYTMVAPGAARALSLIFNDFVAFGFITSNGPISTSFTGTGPYEALLDYNITVGGVFYGSGAQSGETAEIDTSIGTILSTSFDKTYSNSVNGGDYLIPYGFSPVVGQTTVGAGVDVTPSFSVKDYKFEADTAGFASARNIWDTASITLSLTEITPPVPEPSYFAAVGAILLALGSRQFRKHRQQ